MPETEPRLLILGGTREAADLARLAVDRFGGCVRVTTALAGRTRAPAALAGAVRSGGFGGPDGLAAYLRAERIGALVDATHPFATRISANARKACAAAGVPRLQLWRPAWRRRAGDRWIVVPDMAAAAAAIGELAAAQPGLRVLLTVGRQELAAFAGLDGARFVVRAIEPQVAPALPGAEVVVGRGPFALADERRLLANQRIGALVSKASGGTATRAKIDAARALGLPVVLLRRPRPQPGPRAADADRALAWLAERFVFENKPLDRGTRA